MAIGLRRIRTKEEIKKKDRQNKVIIGVILAVIMILSTAGYALKSEKDETTKYGQYKFLKTGNGWQTDVNGLKIVTSFLPRETENISNTLFIFPSDLQDKEIYFVALGGEEKNAVREILQNLYVKRAQYACLEGQEELAECIELPIKNCSGNIFVIKKANTTRIYEDSCIFIEAQEEDVVRAADRFIYGLYDIIKI